MQLEIRRRRRPHLSLFRLFSPIELPSLPVISCSSGPSAAARASAADSSSLQLGLEPSIDLHRAVVLVDGIWVPNNNDKIYILWEEVELVHSLGCFICYIMCDQPSVHWLTDRQTLQPNSSPSAVCRLVSSVIQTTSRHTTNRDECSEPWKPARLGDRWHLWATDRSVWSEAIDEESSQLDRWVDGIQRRVCGRSTPQTDQGLNSSPIVKGSGGDRWY